MIDRPTFLKARPKLPHFDVVGATQFVTFRLFDSLPRELLEELKSQAKVAEALDDGAGCCYLNRSEIAKIVENHLIEFHNKKYYLHTWVIMPNHVHVLLTLLDSHSLVEIMKHHKSFTAREANRLLVTKGSFWAKNYFDRFIRDEEHFYNTASYIENNPVVAGLCSDQGDWQFSSAWKGRAPTWSSDLRSLT